MMRWLGPNSVGLFLFIVFLGFQSLCGERNKPMATDIITEDPINDLAATTIGYPVAIEILWGDSKYIGYHIDWLTLLPLLAGGWVISMAIGRLSIDGGASPVAASLLPRRKHPLFLILAYVAAVPLLATFGLLRDAENGLRGLISPTGGAMYPLLVLALLIGGIPLVAFGLALRRIVDVRSIARRRYLDVAVVAPPNEIATYDPNQ
jgi:hypothetical protein